MSVLSKYYNHKISTLSPVRDDYVRKVSYDEDGAEIITYEKFDYPAFQRSLGTVQDWSLDSLMKAGINPDFPIHTSIPTRLEGVDVINSFGSLADEILADASENPENSSNN